MNLWAITCLFNPAGFRVRRENYRVFRRHLQVPLLAVELAFDDDFALAAGDADILVRRRGGARLWQKERLLDLAIAALPASCDGVIAIDADIVVRDPAWPAAVARALERDPVVQPYARVHHLDTRGERAASGGSTIADWSRDGAYPTPPVPPYEQWWQGNGHIWAARRDVLDRHGFYDGCIVGGGDTAFLAAVTGCIDMPVALHVMGPAQERRYRAWAAPLQAEVAGRVGYVHAEIEHLWHGTLDDRRRQQRHRMLRELDFDPDSDLAIDESGVWQWARASERRALHDAVRDYFRARREDSSPASASPDLGPGSSQRD